MYMTLKLDDNGHCRVHSVSDDGNGWIVTDERYVVMHRWKRLKGALPRAGLPQAV